MNIKTINDLLSMNFATFKKTIFDIFPLNDAQKMFEQFSKEYQEHWPIKIIGRKTLNP